MPSEDGIVFLCVSICWSVRQCQLLPAAAALSYNRCGRHTGRPRRSPVGCSMRQRALPGRPEWHSTSSHSTQRQTCLRGPAPVAGAEGGGQGGELEGEKSVSGYRMKGMRAQPPARVAQTGDRASMLSAPCWLPHHPHLHCASKVAPGVGVLLAAIKALGVLGPASLQAAGGRGQGKIISSWVPGSKSKIHAASACRRNPVQARVNKFDASPPASSPCPSAGARRISP